MIMIMCSSHRKSEAKQKFVHSTTNRIRYKMISMLHFVIATILISMVSFLQMTVKANRNDLLSLIGRAIPFILVALKTRTFIFSEVIFYCQLTLKLKMKRISPKFYVNLEMKKKTKTWGRIWFSVVLISYCVFFIVSWCWLSVGRKKWNRNSLSAIAINSPWFHAFFVSS